MSKTKSKAKAKAKANITHAEIKLSRCGKCNSTDHTPYNNVREMPGDGKTSDGQPYNFIVWRRTSCRQCGQTRIDRSFEYRLNKTTAKPPGEKRKTKTPESGEIISPPKTTKKTVSKPASAAIKSKPAKQSKPTSSRKK